MKANIGISKDHLQEVAEKLNMLLADEFVLYTKTRNYHWNVESMNFSELHEFYEEQYNELAKVIDALAERVRQIGHYSLGRLEDYLKNTNLVEQETTSNPKTQLQNLLDDHETIIREIRELIPDFEDKYNDMGSADYLTGLLQEHEEMAWMIRSHLG
ncbi:DNA starvation/stationary phase protection protein [Membranicola marinus]|uniref:DNA starvation/stationary phase protection protein n=1 Tax=Membranihabitans marinus TaxID=1227546 RepID=A0A953HL45_9BACT|nr:DNA starvation/stationary phase protection protein [Membranihabitans marinus]MBY5957652.1 DNA starvation/stationary phase protection protein [Membranihabitans marinus]